MKRIINQIKNIDCLTMMKTLPNSCFNHIITDIPYDVINRNNYGIRNFNKGDADILLFDLESFLRESIRLSKDKIFIFCSSEQVSEIFLYLELNDLNPVLGVWEKSNPSPVNGQYLWLSGVECCVIGQRIKTIVNNPIWTFSSTKNKNHPTEKPLKLMEYIINEYTNYNDFIYDPCCGSGTTLVAALKNNRLYFGTEISKDYFKISNDRLI